MTGPGPRRARPVRPGALVGLVLGAVLLLVGLRMASAAPAVDAPDTGRLPSATASAAPTPGTTTPGTTTPGPTEPGTTGPGPVGTAPTPQQQPSPPAPTVSAPPVRLLLGDRDVDAPLVPVGVDRSGQLDLPDDPSRVGWWSAGAAPGDATGTVLLGGHVDTVAYGVGALSVLHDAAVGEVVTVVSDDGSRHEYVVAARRSYPKTSLPVDLLSDPDAGPRLVLVTCGGEFDEQTGHYLDNVVVVAVPR